MNANFDISAPILFLARGHSGTAVLAKILEYSGVYMGNANDSESLNETYDSLNWTYQFQRFLVPKYFKMGVGIAAEPNEVIKQGMFCLREHLKYFSGGRWGFKTCASMFAHSLYRFIFPRAKYIYLVRDGRDVVLSRQGYFHLTNRNSRTVDTEYFKVITFGISNDIDEAPFVFPEVLREDDPLMRNKYWVQAKSWKEHIRMMEYLKKTNQLSPNIHMVKYEELCKDPVSVLDSLYNFLELELSSAIKEFSTRLLYKRSLGRWRDYQQYVVDCEENLPRVFKSMEAELRFMGYL